MIILPFFTILCFFAVFSMFDADQTMSFEENRMLAQRPDLNVEDLNGFTGSYATYATEQFPLRPKMMKLYSKTQLTLGKKDVRDTYVTKDGWLLPKEYKVPLEQAKKYIQSILTVVSDPEYSKVDFYYAILPFKTALFYKMDDRYITSENGEFNRKKLITAFQGSPMQTIDVSGYFSRAFSIEELQKMYFKTDLHWNANGAFAAADYIQHNMVPKTIKIEEKAGKSDFSWTLLSEKLYQGDINMRFSNLFDMHEEIPVFIPQTGQNSRYYLSVDDQKPAERGEIIGNGSGKDTVSYNDVYTKNFGYYRIDNPDANSKKRLLILKDSYQNPTTDVFSSVFSEVDVIDPRYFKEPYSFKEFVKQRKIDAVLLMFHQDNFSPELEQFLRRP